MHELIRTTLVFGAVMGITQMSWADVMPVQFDGGGNTSYDGWKDLTRDYYIDYGMGSWPSGISSNPLQIGAAQLVKITGEAYPLNESIYFPSMNLNLNQNELGGTLAIQDSTPLAGVRTIVLQVKIGEGLLHDFHAPGGYPVLKISQGGASIEPAFSTRLNQVPNGFYDEYPIYINTWAFQWNLDQGVTGDLFQIEFSAVTHAQVYALQLDQTPVLQSQQVFANNQLPPQIKLVSTGTPESSGLQTFVTHTFEGPENQTIDIEYSADLTSSNWQIKSGVATDNGTFTVTFNASGDQREIWRRRMFFRAKYSNN